MVSERAVRGTMGRWRGARQMLELKTKAGGVQSARHGKAKERAPVALPCLRASFTRGNQFRPKVEKCRKRRIIPGGPPRNHGPSTNADETLVQLHQTAREASGKQLSTAKSCRDDASDCHGSVEYRIKLCISRGTRNRESLQVVVGSSEALWRGSTQGPERER